MERQNHITSIEVTVLKAEGIPKHTSILKPTYFVEVVIDDQSWQAERSSTGSWDKSFFCKAQDTSVLELRLYVKPRVGRVDFVGQIKGDVKTFLESRHKKDDKQTKSNQDHENWNSLIKRNLALSKPTEESNKDDLGSITFRVTSRSPPNEIENAKEAARKMNDALSPLLKYLKSFMDLVEPLDSVAEIHPYAKTAWTLLTSISKTILSQMDRDERILALAETMADAYAFMNDAKPLEEFELLKNVLALMARQTVECAHFINDYAKKDSFIKRAGTHLFSNADDSITQYQDTFAKLKSAFQERAVLKLAISVVRVLDYAEKTAAAIDLNDLPYAKGARFLLERRCLPSTRKHILNQIQYWSNSVHNDKQIFLLTGVAGSGKSSIAHSVAYQCNEQKRLGSSFFFDQKDPGRNQPNNIFSTIARDLADLDPQVKNKLWDVIKDNRSLRTTGSIQEQFENFILKPAKELTIIGPIVIVIDALDECGNEASRQGILGILGARISELPANFRIFITTRAEGDIDRTFKSVPSLRRARMNEISQQSSDEDISTFIREELSDVMKLSEVEDEGWCAKLVKKSDGLFIWASTVCLFIKEPGTDAVEQLGLVLTEDPEARGLDHLYTTVLEKNFRTDKPTVMRRFDSVVGRVVSAMLPLSVKALNEIDEKNEPKSRCKAELVVQRLGSLLRGVGEETVPIQTLHLSFRDFLTDRERSKVFYVDVLKHSSALAQPCVGLLLQHLKRNICSVEDQFIHYTEISDLPDLISQNMSEALQYSCRFWIHHLCHVNKITKPLEDQIRAFLFDHLLHWIEALNLIGQLDAGLKSLRDLAQWLKQHPPQSADLLEMANDGIHFIEEFSTSISWGPCYVYVSALPFAPPKTKIYKTYISRDDQLPFYLCGQEVDWDTISTYKSDDTPRPLTFSSDWSRMALGLKNGVIQVSEVSTGRVVSKPATGHQGAVSVIVFSPSGSQIATGSCDGTVQFWDGQGGVLGKAEQGHKGSVLSLEFSPNGLRVVSGSYDGAVWIWDTETGVAIRKSMEGHGDVVTSTVFSPNGLRIVSGSRDGTVRVWDAETGEIIGRGGTLRKEGHGPVTSAVFSPNGTRIASGFENGAVQIFEAGTGATIGEIFRGWSYGHSSVMFSPDALQIASWLDNGTVEVWDVKTGNVSESLRADEIPRQFGILISPYYLDTIGRVNTPTGKPLWFLPPCYRGRPWRDSRSLIGGACDPIC